MISWLFLKLVIGEMLLLLCILYRTPLREPLMVVLDCPVVISTLGGILLALLLSTIYTIGKLHLRSTDSDGSVILMEDQVLMANKVLEASLIGFLLFVLLMIGKLHLLLREHSSLKRIIIAEEKQLKERKDYNAGKLKDLKKDVAILKRLIKKLECECERKANQAKAAKANEIAVQKQYEEFQLEYDSLLEYNEIIRNQLQSINQNLLDNRQGGWSSLKSSIIPDSLVQFPCGNQTSIESGGEPDQEIGPQTTNQNDCCICSGGLPISFPRQRRPIYQQLSTLL
ncbi:uncharacterized protein LOC127812029 [Diospyros lotus]|uniref:uncharacterized protein LOC127812029 n=1 Tax=Diospyros lotus TaxID=55363 RepID=UPI002257B8A7|nr:uncharacterized protein LOC127812029 [Diospyros lotus]XP_052208248.1 uncharacterized protein LOC127812029 [Diospyros lotus]XP_052208249.1 uncharacterized protein LOC127812029 [Diospyros lotus]XP_052208250.1 uncharacterized protein LOC127812029 [Diospyros lotus]